MNVIDVPVGDLRFAPYNPRQMNEVQAKNIQTSLEKFDLVQPLVVNRHKGREAIVVGGNQRLLIARKLGRKTVPVVYVDLDEQQERELNVRLNKAQAEFDLDVLANEFEVPELLEWGFSEKELVGSAFGTEEDDFDALAAAQAVTAPTSKRGEVYQLGRHRLMCGDATRKEDVAKLMDGKKADMVFTDPPYGVSIGKKNRFLNSFQPSGRNLKDIKDDSETPEDLYAILLPAFKILRAQCASSCAVYVCAPPGGDFGLMMMMMKEAGFQVRHQIVWAKNAPTFSMGRLDYDYKHEAIIYTWTDKHVFYGGGEQKTTVWEFDKPRENKLHPTMKPVALVTNAIKNSTKSDQIVLDVYGGSGSTLIAAEQTGRTCFAIELDERYCDVIRQRYERHVNNDRSDG